jgi:hypothetical protein
LELLAIFLLAVEPAGHFVEPLVCFECFEPVQETSIVINKNYFIGNFYEKEKFFII